MFWRGIKVLLPGVFLISLTCWGQSWQTFGEGVISCDERAAIISNLNRISYISLDSKAVRWRTITHETVDSRPILAANAFLVLGDHYNRLYAFSTTTGKRIWSKSFWTEDLASDGNYFYVVGAPAGSVEAIGNILGIAPRTLEALDPASGAVLWSLKLQRRKTDYDPFLEVHGGLLFAADLVIDISRRAIVYRWPAKSFTVSSLDFADDGSIFLKGSWGMSGMIAIYDRNFNPIRKFRVGKGDVVRVSAAGEQIVALLQYGNPYGRLTTLVSFTREGKKLWRIQWPATGWDFHIAGDNLFMIEPGKVYGDFRLASRQLATGRLNWITWNRAFDSPPGSCADTAYATDGDHVYGFAVKSGAEVRSKRNRSRSIATPDQPDLRPTNPD